MHGPSSRMQEQRRLWRKQRVPISVFFELTPRCTFDCKMCYIHLTREQMGNRRELSTEQWLQIVDKAIEAGMLYGVLTGGECMLHEGFWQIYDRLIAGGVVLSVNTNGYALTDADIARFAENPPASIRITLYGASEESYERVTGHRALHRVLENIKKLKAARVAPRLTTTLSRYNSEEFGAVLALGKELGLIVKHTFDLFEPNADTGRHSEDFSLSAQELVHAELAAWNSMGWQTAQNPSVSDPPARMTADPSYRGLGCAAGRTSYTVHWDGRFSPCFNIPSTVSLLDTTLEDAWTAIQKLADDYPLPVECRSCALLHACNPCPVFRHDPNDPAHCNPARCEATRLRYKLGLTGIPHEDQTASGGFDPDDVHEAL